MPTDAEWAWAAGLFEGEGCVFLSIGRRTQRSLIVNMTDEDVLRRFHAIVGCGSLFSVKEHATWQPNWKPQWRWSASRWSDIRELHERFSPWLGERRRAKFVELLAHPPRDPHARRKTHCKRGHPLDGPASNVYVVGTQRRCNHCRVARKAERAVRADREE